VGGGDAGDVLPALVGGDPAGRLANNESDLTLEREEFGAGGALDRATRGGERGRWLEEVRRELRRAPALLNAGRIVEMDRNNLAGSLDAVRHSYLASSLYFKSYTI